MRKPKLRIEKVRICLISGDPGCLGWPDYHEESCEYAEEEFLFCECGGHDVYGDVGHTEECYFANTQEAQQLRAVDLLRLWLRKFHLPKRETSPDKYYPF